VSTALAVGVAVPAAAWAQAAPASQAPSAGVQLPEVVVTATRKEERLQDVPISVTVFSQEQLNRHNISTAEDLTTYTPSLSSTNFLGSTNTTFGLRGFTQDIGTQPAVGVYFADVVMPRGAANQMTIGDGAGPGTFFDLENVQVLNGPQGTLFGRNTTGGAILLVPKRPTNEWEGYLETTFGNFNEKRVQGVVNVPVNDKVAFRFGLDHHVRDGYLENVTNISPSNFDDINYTALRASMLIHFTPEFENYTVFSYTHNDANGTLLRLVSADTPGTGLLRSLAAAQLAANPGKYTVSSVYPGAADRETVWQVVNTTTWHAAEHLTVKNVASYAELKLDLGSSVFGLNLIPQLPLNPPLAFVNSNPLPGGHTGYQSTMTEEFQLQGHALNEKLDYTTGVYVEASLPLGPVGSLSPAFLSCAANGFVCSNPLGAGGNSWTEAQTDFHNYGVYLQASYALTDQLKLTGGVRYTWDREHVNGQLLAYQYPVSFAPTPPSGFVCTNPDVSLPECRQSLVTKSQAPTAVVDLDYKPVQSVLLYAKYSRGYRAGGINLQAPTGYQTFQPETLNAYELGAKTSFSGAVPGTFNVAMFYNDLSNKAIQVNFAPKNGIFPPNETAILNAGAARIYGVEVQTSFKPTHDTRIDFGYTYLNTKITSIAPVVVPPTSPYFTLSNALAGDPLTYAPESKFTLTGTYDLPVPESVGNLSVAATWSYSTPQLTGYTEREPSGKLAGDSWLGPRSLLDLNLDWRNIGGRPVDLSLFATNVTNQYYLGLGLPQAQLGFEVAQIGQPRMFGVRLRYSFGR
jgi:iron complex outermembrane receptor protein